MRCDNCGKDEVNFHYTSMINGNTTETHLCADCAGKLGKTSRQAEPDTSDMSFEEIFAELFGMRPKRSLMRGYSMIIPTVILPTVHVVVSAPDLSETRQDKESGSRPEIDIRTDETMRLRREMNVLREQLKRACDAEDYEKAATLRDSIKTMERQANSSETPL